MTRTQEPDAGGVTSDNSEIVAGARLRVFLERIEQLEGEKKEIAETIKETFAEAKGEGFDTAIMRDILKIRRQDEDERAEHETILDLYLKALEEAR